MNDEECQPEYCDCDGFHTGECRQRFAARFLAAWEWYRNLNGWTKLEFANILLDVVRERGIHMPGAAAADLLHATPDDWEKAMERYDSRYNNITAIR